MSKSIAEVGPREAKNQRAASTPISSSSSSRVMNVAGPLAHRHILAVAHEANPGDQQHPDRGLVVAHRLGGVAHPGHRPVVVLAPDVDQLVEAAAELLGDVADVRGEVGRLAVGADDHPVLVVAEGRRAEPDRAVLLVEVAAARAAARWPAPPSPRHAASAPSSTRRNGRRDARGTPRSRRGPAPTPSGRRPPASAPGGLGRGPDLVRARPRRARRRSRRGSHPPGPARRAGCARTEAPSLRTWPPESLK